jgi:hypothetical protein
MGGTLELPLLLRYDPSKREAELIWLESERARLALESHATMRVDQIHAVRPAGVRTLGGVPEFVQHCGKLYPQLAHAKSGDVLTLVFILRTGEDDLIPDVALHLPHITGMSFGDVYGQKGDTILVLLVELVEGGNLPPKGRSGVTAEDEHYGLAGVEGRKLDSTRFVLFHQRKIRSGVSDM